MGNFLLIFNEIAYLVLQHPEELPVSLKKIPKLRPYLFAALLFSGLCMGTGLYLLRTTYNLSFVIAVLGVAFVHSVFFVVWSVCLGALVDALVQKPDRPGRGGRMRDLAEIVIFSSIPTAFFLPGAMTAKLLFQPGLLALPLWLGLFVWSQIVVVRALQYLYEMPLRECIQVYVRSFGILFVFPLVAGSFFLVEIFAAAL